MKVDFRSDTVTKPSKEMLDLMFSVKVGDNVFDEDEQTNKLEKYAANLFGKESAIFCPSGTMTNQIAIRLHTNIGSEVICDKLSHVYNYEGGGIAAHSLSSVKLLNGLGGQPTAENIKLAINADDIHFPNTSLISLEDTCNKGGGTIYDINELSKIKSLAVANNLPVHLDGARVFNALVERGNQDYKTYGDFFDTISICLSKGLGAPIGSLLLGSKKQISNAKRVRKMFGGGMRQTGYLASAGLFALKNNISRLKEDHLKARMIVDVLLTKKSLVKVYPAITNIIVFECVNELHKQQLISKFLENEIKVVSFGNSKLRMVTHLDISDDMINYTISVIDKIID